MRQSRQILAQALVQQHLPTLQAALAHGGGSHEVSDVITGILEGQFIPIVCADAWAVCEVVSYPRAKHIHVWLAGGDSTKLETVVLAQVEDLARHLGASRVTAVARKGWVRRAARHGFRAQWVCYEKEIRDDYVEVQHNEQKHN